MGEEGDGQKGKPWLKQQLDELFLWDGNDDHLEMLRNAFLNGTDSVPRGAGADDKRGKT
jgi:hypothetical protein